MPSCGIRCTAASCCSSSACRCCWDRGGAWLSRRYSPRCSPFAPASRSAHWSKACPIMLTTPRACAIVWCPDSGELQRRRTRMPDSKTYTGGCHCGQVRFECTSDLAMVTACNCSICTKKGLHFTFLDPKSFQLRAGDENLKEYLFNKHAIHHQLCIDCGVDVFARGKKPDGTDVVALNVSCIDGVELSKLKMTPMDGRSM